MNHTIGFIVARCHEGGLCDQTQISGVYEAMLRRWDGRSQRGRIFVSCNCWQSQFKDRVIPSDIGGGDAEQSNQESTQRTSADSDSITTLTGPLSSYAASSIGNSTVRRGRDHNWRSGWSLGGELMIDDDHWAVNWKRVGYRIELHVRDFRLGLW